MARGPVTSGLLTARQTAAAALSSTRRKVRQARLRSKGRAAVWAMEGPAQLCTAMVIPLHLEASVMMPPSNRSWDAEVNSA